jgi:D-glycerate 3-kinase
MQTFDISRFIRHHQLPESYSHFAKKWFFPLAEQLFAHQKQIRKPLVIGINGAQGSGKSTLAELLVLLFVQHYHISATSISIDDFYYTRQQRIALADQIHPLLLTRGVPGTHDTSLAQQTLDRLIQGKEPTKIPRFNKAEDDRFPQDQWDTVGGKMDIIIFEGWCLGAEPQTADDLLMPVNELEAKNDAELIWRKYVNQQLQGHYCTLFNTVNLWIMLKAPSFDCVFNWRLQQENKLRESINDKSRTMDEHAIKQFIQHYQRITEHLLMTLPKKANYLFELDEQRNIVRSSAGMKSMKIIKATI